MKRVFRLDRRERGIPRDVGDELRFHLDIRTQEFIDAGTSPDAARYSAMAAFGDHLTAVERECRRVRTRRERARLRGDILEGLVQDVRFAVRSLRKSLGFTAVATLTRAMTRLLFDVQPTDPLTFLAVSLVLIGVATAACPVPARRATTIDPMLALRSD